MSPRARPKAAAEIEHPIEVRALAPGDWNHLAALFGANGACGGCWCMWWRLPRGGKLWEASKGEPNRRAFRRLLTAGKVRGCLAFAAGTPVGWVCVGPASDFPRMQRVKALAGERDPGTWAVVCFFIRSGWRARGVASQLLAGAVELARLHGATRVEGYPVVPKGDAKMPAAFAWTGVPALFDRAGFRDATPEGSTRPIVVRGLRPKR